MSDTNNNPIKPSPSNAYQRPVANIFDFYLTGNITEAKDYQDWNQILRTATENDGIVVHIKIWNTSATGPVSLARCIL